MHASTHRARWLWLLLSSRFAIDASFCFDPRFIDCCCMHHHIAGVERRDPRRRPHGSLHDGAAGAKNAGRRLQTYAPRVPCATLPFSLSSFAIQCCTPLPNPWCPLPLMLPVLPVLSLSLPSAKLRVPFQRNHGTRAHAHPTASTFGRDIDGTDGIVQMDSRTST